MSEFNVIIEKDKDGYFVASVPELPGCHTQAKNMDQLITRAKEAIQLCMEEYRPKRSPREFVGIQRISI